MSANIFLPPSPVAPPFLIITAITQAVKAVVTVSTPNSYVPNQLVYMSVPASYGMYEIDALTGQILSVDITNLIFTININTTNFNAFSVPVDYREKPASLSCAGSRNLQFNNFNNISVPFHAVNGSIGN